MTSCGLLLLDELHATILGATVLAVVGRYGRQRTSAGWFQPRRGHRMLDGQLAHDRGRPAC